MDALSNNTLKSYYKLKPPEIGVHIRRRNFKYGFELTEIDFFYKTIIEIRKKYSSSFCFTIFRDENLEELDRLLTINNVKFYDNSEDILDFLHLGMTPFSVLSKHSTFSLWGAFFADGNIYFPD